MDEPQFVRHWDYPAESLDAGWYAATYPEGFPENWTPDDRDPRILGPYSTDEEAHAALDAFLDGMGIDLDGLTLAAKHAGEVLEADIENYPGNELAKRRFQMSVKAFAAAVGKGNPPAMVVGLAAGSLFTHLCAAYPTAGSEVFRIIGNMWRRERNIPPMEFGVEPTYEKEE